MTQLINQARGFGVVPAIVMCQIEPTSLGQPADNHASEGVATCPAVRVGFLERFAVGQQVDGKLRHSAGVVVCRHVACMLEIVVGHPQLAEVGAEFVEDIGGVALPVGRGLLEVERESVAAKRFGDLADHRVALHPGVINRFDLVAVPKSQDRPAVDQAMRHPELGLDQVRGFMRLQRPIRCQVRSLGRPEHLRQQALLGRHVAFGN